MSGVRSYSFREGDRSEYLAQFLLSAAGLCTFIPRQEDIGFDFSCTIADQQTGTLTFGYPYLISIKSISNPVVDVVPSAAVIAANNFRHVGWLFRQELPIFLGVVDKDAVSLRIFSMVPLWFLYYHGGPNIGSLSLMPRLDPNNQQDVGLPIQGAQLNDWPGHFHYDVDLGHPVTVLNFGVIQDADRLRAAKDLLRRAIMFAQKNLLHFQLQIPHFYWFAKMTSNSSGFQPAFSYDPVPPTLEARQAIMAELAPSLISFALHFKHTGDANSLKACANLLAHAPANTIPE